MAVGEKLKHAKGGYDDALGKLSMGKGNLVRCAENLRALGVKPSKILPQKLVDTAGGPTG
jgi:DNA recombination protein RmuC